MLILQPCVTSSATLILVKLGAKSSSELEVMTDPLEEHCLFLLGYDLGVATLRSQLFFFFSVFFRFPFVVVQANINYIVYDQICIQCFVNKCIQQNTYNKTIGQTVRFTLVIIINGNILKILTNQKFFNSKRKDNVFINQTMFLAVAIDR